MSNNRLESALEMLARHPPCLRTSKRTTTPASRNSIQIPAMYLSYWTRFRQDVQHCVNDLGNQLQFPVLRADLPELFVSANKLGLTGRFVQNVTYPVTAVFEQIPELSRLVFSDSHASGEGTQQASGVSDIMLSLFHPGMARDSIDIIHVAAGEIKTPWTLKLNQIPISGTQLERETLGKWLGVLHPP